MQEENLEIRKNGGGSVRLSRRLAIPATGSPPCTKDAAVNMEKNSVKCAVFEPL